MTVDEVCGHTIPMFGCRSCIATERTNTLLEAKKTTPRPLCPECGHATELYDSSAECMTLSFICASGFTEDGEAICDGEVEVNVR